jgi:glycosyltransferase involved in cell wall biosynthesis
MLTTCMGRLNHLQKTLPGRIHPDVENIVVDWSCPDNCGDWIEAHYKEKVEIIRVPGKQYYHRTMSRNIGLKSASGEYICNADADLIINENFFDYIIPLLDKEYFIAAIPFKVFMPTISRIGEFENHMLIDPNLKAEKVKNLADDTDTLNQNQETNETILYWTGVHNIIQKCKLSLTGFSIFPRAVYEKFGGYDEIFDTSDSGGEDLDLRLKLMLEGKLKEKIIRSDMIDVLGHSDQERVKFLNSQGSDFWNTRVNGLKKIINKWGKNALSNSLPQHLLESIL